MLHAFVLRAGKPAWQRIWLWIESRVHPLEVKLAALESSADARLQSVEARLQSAEARLPSGETRLDSVEGGLASLVARVAILETWSHEREPALANTLATLRAFAHELALARRETEAIERDVGEIRARLDQPWADLPPPAARGSRGASAPVHHAPAVGVPRPLGSAVSAANLKVNLGCGHGSLPGYVNLDRRALPGVDVVADLGAVPVGPGHVAEIFSSHVLDHVPGDELRQRLLPHWRSLLRPGGTFRAVVPDGEAMCAGVAAGSYSLDDFSTFLFHADDVRDRPVTLFSPAALMALLAEAGFADIEVPVTGRPQKQCLEFEITARWS